MNKLAKCVLYMHCDNTDISDSTTTTTAANSSDIVEPWQLKLFTSALWFIVILLALIFAYCIWILTHVAIDAIRNRRRIR